MLNEQLQTILAVEEQERIFYHEHLKPALYRLEHAEDLYSEREQIAKLVSGTHFESAFWSLEGVNEAPEHLYKLNHLFHQKMQTNHMSRQSEVESLLNTAAQSDWTPAVLYHLACLYSHGDSAQDCERADGFLHQALDQELAQQPGLDLKIRELLAQNYDRWQLRKTPPQPQKYGTLYADHYDVLKGLEKDKLIPPYPGYLYQIQDIEQARQCLGLCSLLEQAMRK